MKGFLKVGMLAAGFAVAGNSLADNLFYYEWEYSYPLDPNNYRSGQSFSSSSAVGNRFTRDATFQSGRVDQNGNRESFDVTHEVSGSVSPSGPLSSPILKGKVNVDDGAPFNSYYTDVIDGKALGFAVQEYSYTGSGTQSFDAAYRFDAQTRTNGVDGLADVSAFYRVFKGEFSNSAFEQNVDTLLPTEHDDGMLEEFLLGDDTGGQLLDEWNSVGEGTGSGGLNSPFDVVYDVNGRLSFSLSQGDSFYVIAFLKADVFSAPGSVDASNTLEFDFFNAGTNEAASNLVAVTSAVPIPAAAWLFGSALAGIIGLRRKARAAA